MRTKVIVIATAAILFGAFNATANVDFEEDFSLPIVYLHLVVDAGSADDPTDKLGLANIASRMLLRGTHKRGKAQFNEELNRLGGELDVDVNEEGTIYYAAVLSENIDPFLALVDETLSRPKFTAEELRTLKKEAESEILARKASDKQLAQYNHTRFFYGSHPYGKPPGGTRAGVQNINYKDIVNHYVRRFSGKTLHVFGTGAVKREVIENWFTRLADKLNAVHPDAQPMPAVPRPRIPSGRRALIVDKPKATQTQILMGGAGTRPEQPGYYEIMLANYSFGGPSFETRMMREIRVKRGWTYGASCAFRFGKEPRHYSMYIFPKTADTVPAINLTIDLFQNWVTNGITRDEYDFARDALVNSAPFNYDTSKKRLGNATVSYLWNFPKTYHRDFAVNIEKVQHENVAPALKSFFNPENLTLTVVGDSSKLEAPISTLPGFSKPEVKSYLED